MSATFSSKRESRESLKLRVRCGFSPCAFQMRCTTLGETPTAFAILRTLQCVPPGGVEWSVRSTTLVIVSGDSGLTRERRAALLSSPSTPLSW
jgi:hypothetical protein